MNDPHDAVPSPEAVEVPAEAVEVPAEAVAGATSTAAADGPDPVEAGEAEALTGVAEFRASVEQARQQVRALLGSDPRTKLRFVGDLLAVVPIATMLVWMSSHDGGFERYFFQVAAGVVLVASPVALLEASRLPRLVRRLLGLYGLGLVVALATAGDRNEWVSATLVLTIVPVCGLAAHRLWRRPWGPAALLTLLGLAFGSYWYRAFLSWWGDTLVGRSPVWRPLSWHNQSSMLMGAFGVLGLGIAAAGKRYVAAIGVLVAGGGLAGAWLAGSRGGALATALGCALALVGGVRSDGLRGLTRVGAGFLAAALVVVGLSSMIPEGATVSDRSGNFEGTSVSPLGGRATRAGGTARARLLHMEAAVGMFLDDPLTGEGPGSYRRMALQHTPPNANLTASAHNEYLEVLAEEGLLAGLPFAALHALFALAAFGAIWRRRDVGDDEVRGPLQLGAALVVLSIGAHAAIDFDWTFPVLPALLAVGAALLVRDVTADGEPEIAPLDRRPADDTPEEAAEEATPDEAGATMSSATGGRLAWLAVTPIVLLLAAGVWGASMERARAEGGADLSAEAYADLPLGWQGDRLSLHAVTLARRGEHELAARTIQRATRWSPDVPSYRAAAQIVLYRAEAISAAQLLGRIDEIDPGFGSRNLVAEALIDRGDLPLARELTESLLATYDQFTEQGIEGVRAETWYLRAELEAVAGDCTEAGRQIDRAVERGDVPEAFLAREFGPLVALCPGIVPGVELQTG